MACHGSHGARLEALEAEVRNLRGEPSETQERLDFIERLLAQDLETHNTPQEGEMPKYLWQVSYTPQGVQGLQKDGGVARRSAVQRLVEQAGGKLESFYFAFGEADAYTIAELPDTSTAAAVSLAVNALGLVHLRTVPLMTAEEIDTATKKSIDYRPPGSGTR